VDDSVILEIKAVTTLPIGLLLNFHAVRLKDGLRRFVG
jgi:hypothetical protein